jgi:hypothetical protein
MKTLSKIFLNKGVVRMNDDSMKAILGGGGYVCTCNNSYVVGDADTPTGCASLCIGYWYS